jgi:hypothetical protein
MAIVVIMTAVVAVPATASAEAPAPEVRACVDAEDSQAEVGNTCEDGATVSISEGDGYVASCARIDLDDYDADVDPDCLPV